MKYLKSLEISKPLHEDPKDLGNIHYPTLTEYEMESFEGIARWNSYICCLLEGNDITCSFYADLPNYNWKKWYIVMGLIQGKSGLRLLKVVGSDKYFFDRTEEKIEFSNSEGDVKYVIKRDEFDLLVNKKFGDKEVYLNLKFDDLKMPFWYNKGRAATIYPDGTRISGFEQISHAHGHGIFDGTRTKLRGFADHEFFFYGENILEKILKYGNEFWMPFLCGEIRGIFVTFHNYKDAGVIINDQYFIPRSFDIQVMRWINWVPIDVRVSAETEIGKLTATYSAVGVLPPANVPSKVFCTLERKNGDIIKRDGLGWIEHITREGFERRTF